MPPTPPAQPEPSTGPTGFVALVPVKPPRVGKSRLGDVADVRRRDLAGAFALDAVGAVVACPEVAEVVVVTDDAAFYRDLADLGAVGLPDGDTHDLNATLRQAAAEARRRWPALQPVAVCADLPALRSADLGAALHQARVGGAWFVTDAEGVGTTLYTAAHDAFAPRFGIGSALAHEASGARAVPGDLASLRCDVDDVDDLREALRLGVGPHTAAVAAPLVGRGPDDGGR